MTIMITMWLHQHHNTVKKTKKTVNDDDSIDICGGTEDKQ